MESELYYFYKPSDPLLGANDVDFLNITEFLADEPACKILWELLDTQFRTRSKFLSIWPSVRYVAVQRDVEGSAAGFLLVSAPVNWQIDYVVVRPDCRGQGIATKLLKATLHHAYVLKPPYVMLTSKESLRPLYESCGFSVVPCAVAVS